MQSTLSANITELSAVNEQLRQQAETLLSEISALEDAIRQVEAMDQRRPHHRVRLLRQQRGFVCSACHVPGSGLSWRCVTPRCPDSFHLQCLVGPRN
ncbi:unnamed protein product [Closterium sp. NIES-54]